MPHCIREWSVSVSGLSRPVGSTPGSHTPVGSSPFQTCCQWTVAVRPILANSSDTAMLKIDLLVSVNEVNSKALASLLRATATFSSSSG